LGSKVLESKVLESKVLESKVLELKGGEEGGRAAVPIARAAVKRVGRSLMLAVVVGCELGKGGREEQGLGRVEVRLAHGGGLVLLKLVTGTGC
jgi:hypothetical protein